MPIVTVTMLEGRDDVAKSFLARAIVDAMAEIAGASRDKVEVIFNEPAPNQWAFGERLGSQSRNSASPASARARRVGYLDVLTIKIRLPLIDDYLAWRRTTVFPFMAEHDGFVSSTMLADTGDPELFRIVNKWVSKEAADEYGLRWSASEYVEQSNAYLTAHEFEEVAGDVVDVFSARQLAK